jgi:hypothetical protein
MDWIGLPDKYAGWCGLVGSLLLLVPPCRDQIVKRFYTKWKSARSGGLAEMRTAIADGAKDGAAYWQPVDAVSIVAGAILLAMSYVLRV